MTDARVIVRGVRKVQGLPPRPPLPRAPRQEIGPRPGDAYWQERGWTERGAGTFTGQYQAGRERFKGQIDAREREFLIHRPPDALRLHPHWVCFRYQENGWYLVHFALRPQDMSAGIMEIERILNEALGTVVRDPVAPRAPQALSAPSRLRTEPAATIRPAEPRRVAAPPRVAPTRAQIRREIHDQTRRTSHFWRWLYALFVVLILALVFVVV